MDEWGIEPVQEVEIQYTPSKKRSVWEIMNSSIDKKFMPTQEEKERLNEYLFHSFLARFEATLDLALVFDTKNIPIDKQYDIVRTFVPKGKIPFEKRKKSSTDASLENIMEYYRCNEKTAREYMALMPESEIQRINQKYQKGKIK